MKSIFLLSQPKLQVVILAKLQVVYDVCDEYDYSLALYLQHPFSSSGGRIVAMRLLWRLRNLWVGRLLVKISASWSSVETNLTVRSLRRTLSRTKWKSTPMCFVRAWNTGLEAMAKAEMLSHHRIGAAEMKTPRFLRSVWSQQSSAEAKAKALYYDLVEDLDTVSYFFADHVMGFGPR